MTRAALVALVLLVLVAAPTPARAMGRYIDYDVVAWNDDGTAALLSRIESSSGTVGVSRRYVLTGVGDRAPLVVSFDNTLDPDVDSQKIDRATCVRDALRLSSALATRRFRGVGVRADRCRTDRAVVAPSKSEAARVASSRLGDLRQQKPATMMGREVRDALVHAFGSVPQGEALSATGALTILRFGDDDDGPRIAPTAVIVGRGAAATVLVPDLG
jgi:hypothetical protein